MTDKQRSLVLNALKMGGVFVSCGTDKKINIMDTQWGTIGRMWGRDIFVLPVRKKKYSHGIIHKNMSFVVNVPTAEMRSKLIQCQNLSGKDVNKFNELGFTPVPAKRVNSVMIDECSIHLECKVIYISEMHASRLNPTIAKDMYIDKEYHTLFFGEIIRTSITPKH